jgi:hypothetical protein
VVPGPTSRKLKALNELQAKREKQLKRTLGVKQQSILGIKVINAIILFVELHLTCSIKCLCKRTHHIYIVFYVFTKSLSSVFIGIQVNNMVPCFFLIHCTMGGA